VRGELPSPLQPSRCVLRSEAGRGGPIWSFTGQLLVDGEEDRLACGLALSCADTAAVMGNEKPSYTFATSLTVCIIHDTGHDLALDCGGVTWPRRRNAASVA
jgi:hypothetical protein